LAEKNRLDGQRRSAESVVRTIEAVILPIEQDFRKLIAAGSAEDSDVVLRSLEAFRSAHGFIEDVFVFQANGRIRFPAAKLLYLPALLLPPSPSDPWPVALAGRMAVAQRSEFEQKNYRDALERYRALFEAGAEPFVKGALLNAMARVQKKSGSADEAMKTYAAIARDYGDVLITGGMPLGLASRLELGALQASSGDIPSAAETYLELFQRLLQGGWPIEQALYENTVETLKNSLNGIFMKAPSDSDVQSVKSAFLALENQERERRKSTERLTSFLAGAAEAIKARTPGIQGPSSLASRWTLDLEKNSFLVSLSPADAVPSGEAGERWGILFDPDLIRDALLRPALANAFSAEETAWAVRGQDGRVLAISDKAPSGMPSYRTGFVDNFPRWSLELYSLNPRFLQTLLASRQRVFFFMFLLIAGILGFGLILAVRAVSHELELARMKSDFVSTVSHEFKSPLTSIRQLAEMLQAGRVPSEDRRRQYYDVLVEQSERLSLLIENILSLAKIEDGRKRFEFKPVEIGALLRETVAPISDRVRHDGFTIEMETEGGPHVIIADGPALAQAVTNLVDNAVKYSGDARRVILRSSVRGPDLVVSVRDFGQGIPRDEQAKVFDRFYRGGDPLTRSVKGSGLGLTLVKEIIDAHRGKVLIESEPGRGSTFSIVLPLSRTGALNHGKDPDHRR